MTTLHTIVLLVHVLIGLAIIGLVLLQRGKGAEAGAAFGAGVSGTVFGARGSANFLSRSTGLLAALFFITSLSLAYLGSQRRPPESLLDTAGQSVPAPASPALMLPAPGTGQAGSSGELPALQDAPAPGAPAGGAENVPVPDDQ